MPELTTEMTLPLPQDRVFAFFSDATNLERITPPELNFHITSSKPIAMAAGALIDYKLRLFGLPFAWQTRIAAWDPPRQFVDEQLSGPYKTWIHTHTFEPVGGGTRIRDHVEYALPLAPLGNIALPIVRRQLARIFAYREQAIHRILAGER